MGGADDVLGAPRSRRSILYVGAFAFIIGNFNFLAGVIFNSHSPGSA